MSEIGYIIPTLLIKLISMKEHEDCYKLISIDINHLSMRRFEDCCN